MDNKNISDNYVISIITIVLNQKDLIDQTIESVLEQEYVDVEYIVIDGGSTDGTLERIAIYKERLSHFVSEPDGGIYQAINKGISLASRPLVGLIHCGDYYQKNVLKIVCDQFQKTNADVIYGDIEIIESVGDKYISRFPKANHILLKRRMSIFHPSTFISLKAYKELGLYDTTYKSAADYDFLLKLYINKYSFVYISEVLAVFRKGGISSKNFKLSRDENIRIRSKYFGFWKGFRYGLIKTAVHIFFSLRKHLVLLFIGENNFNRVKRFIYRNNG